MQELDLRVLEFVLLAILLMLMHVATLLEIHHAELRQTATSDIDRVAAATWSFLGVLLTLGAGVYADLIPGTAGDAAALGVPLFFIGRWAFFHWRISKVLDVAALKDEMDGICRTAVLRVFAEAGTTGLTANEISQGALDRIEGARLLSRNAGLLKRFVPVSMDMILEQFLPTSKRFGETIAELEKDDVLERDGEKFYLRGHRNAV